MNVMWSSRLFRHQDRRVNQLYTSFKIGGSTSTPAEMSSAKQMIAVKIGQKKVMVFSKTYCPYCVSAKKVLEGYIKSGELSEDDYEVMELEGLPDMAAIQDQLRNITGARSMPRVFINGKCIGGGDETAAAHRSGKLKQLLAAKN